MTSNPKIQESPSSHSHRVWLHVILTSWLVPRLVPLCHWPIRSSVTQLRGTNDANNVSSNTRKPSSWLTWNQTYNTCLKHSCDICSRQHTHTHTTCNCLDKLRLVVQTSIPVYVRFIHSTVSHLHSTCRRIQLIHVHTGTCQAIIEAIIPACVSKVYRHA